ncbi:hypothetical protein [Streptacidiphilus cavernicola]|uniref:Uncharacterized protein n=1 Tax=Streptacidiphilus cavernicola TaxID=3342716 RepID=A0ABV6W325_9ACTN
MSDYVRWRPPELDPEPLASATSLRTSTPTGDFILDRVGALVIVSPCPGHGGQYAPLIGRLTADLALGKAGGPGAVRTARSRQHGAATSLRLQRSSNFATSFRVIHVWSLQGADSPSLCLASKVTNARECPRIEVCAIH